MAKMQATHRYDAPVEAVGALLSDADFVRRKYEAEGATDISIQSAGDADAPTHTIRRKVEIDLPGFAKKVMSPTNTLVQVDDWSPPDGTGGRVCSYTVEVQGVPSRISGTVTLSPDGAGTRQDTVAEVKVSIPLLGGKLEKFAVDSGLKLLDTEATFTAQELAGRS